MDRSVSTGVDSLGLLFFVESYLKVGLAALIIARMDESIVVLYPNEMLECKVWIASCTLPSSFAGVPRPSFCSPPS